MTSKLKAKSQLRHQMTEDDRQRNDTEMENWAVEHERRKEEGYFPKGVESEEGKICWESMCWVLKFEWNYSQNRHQIMKAGISEEDELKSILHSLADFQDAPPNIPPSLNCISGVTPPGPMVAPALDVNPTPPPSDSVCNLIFEITRCAPVVLL